VWSALESRKTETKQENIICYTCIAASACVACPTRFGILVMLYFMSRQSGIVILSQRPDDRPLYPPAAAAAATAAARLAASESCDAQTLI